MKNVLQRVAMGFFFLWANMLFSQEIQRYSSDVEKKPFSRDLDEAITLHLTYTFNLGLKPLKPSHSFVQLIVWDDGRVLAGKEISKEENADTRIVNYEYCFGKIDLEKVQTLLHSIETNLQLRNHQTKIQNLGPSASFYRLQVNYADGILDVDTWEQYENAEFYPKSNVIFSDTATERGVLLLPDFYKGWKIIKKDMFDIRDEIMSNSASVNVEWEKGKNKLFVRDKAGKVIMECTFFPTSVPVQTISPDLKTPDSDPNSGENSEPNYMNINESSDNSARKD